MTNTKAAQSKLASTLGILKASTTFLIPNDDRTVKAKIAMDDGWRWQRLDGNQLQLRK